MYTNMNLNVSWEHNIHRPSFFNVKAIIMHKENVCGYLVRLDSGVVKPISLLQLRMLFSYKNVECLNGRYDRENNLLVINDSEVYIIDDYIPPNHVISGDRYIDEQYEYIFNTCAASYSTFTAIIEGTGGFTAVEPCSINGWGVFLRGDVEYNPYYTFPKELFGYFVKNSNFLFADKKLPYIRVNNNFGKTKTKGITERSNIGIIDAREYDMSVLTVSDTFPKCPTATTYVITAEQFKYEYIQIYLRGRYKIYKNNPTFEEIVGITAKARLVAKDKGIVIIDTSK